MNEEQFAADVAQRMRKEFGSGAAERLRCGLAKVRALPDYVRDGPLAQLVIERGKRVLQLLSVQLH
jgi:hypothetical protein